jgi:DNA-binding MarR family transcriptional regulator
MGRPGGSGETLHTGVVFLHFVLDLSRDAEVALGPFPTANRDIGVLRIVHQDEGVSSSALVEKLGLPRSTVARALARMLEAGLVERDRDSQDARRARWLLTRLGQQTLDRYVTATADTCRRHHLPVERLLSRHGRAPEAPSDSSVVAVLDAADRLRSAGAEIGAVVARDEAGVGLTAAVDRAALLFIAERRSARPGDLADDLALSPAGVTSLVDRLEGNGLVVRERGTTGDGRAVVITLTTAGQRAVDVWLTAFRQHERRLLDALTMAPAVAVTTAKSPAGSRLGDEGALLPA